MTNADRVARLKRRLTLADNAQDALLNDLLDDAAAYALDYTGLQALPDSADGILTELAAIAYTRLGMEGQASHGEGGVSVSVEQGVPGQLKARLDRLRVAKVG